MTRGLHCGLPSLHVPLKLCRSNQPVLIVHLEMKKSTTSRLRQRVLEQRLEDGFGNVDQEEAETLLDAPVSVEKNTTILEKVRFALGSFSYPTWAYSMFQR